MTTKKLLLAQALQVLIALGLPRAQQNERSAVTLLALLGLRPRLTWVDAGNPLIGITPIMEWAKTHYDKTYAPNTRETVRRYTMHQLVEAGIALYNPDQPQRPVNSPKAVYQIAPDALELIRQYGRTDWSVNLDTYLSCRSTLVQQYAAARQQQQVPVKIADGITISLTPGAHSRLIKSIIEDFAPRFAPGRRLWMSATRATSGATSTRRCFAS